MPRIARRDIKTNYLHVMIQGIERRQIFKDEKYKNYYMKLLTSNMKNYKDIKILAYCIMDNHIHLLIYCEEINNLSKLMRKTNTSYALYYNKIEDRVGYVFRNRYTIQTIKNKNHLLNCLVYIHKNPVKAGIVKFMYDYKYSSYRLYKSGEIEDKVVQLIFKNSDYINEFNFIHNKLENNDFNDILDIKEEKTSQEKILNIIEEYCRKKFLTIDIIRKNNCFLIELIKLLKTDTNINDKEISTYLGIGKNRIRNILKKD